MPQENSWRRVIWLFAIGPSYRRAKILVGTRAGALYPLVAAEILNRPKIEWYEF